MKLPADFPRGKNGGINRWANKFPATCYKCGASIPVGKGRIVSWRSKKDQGKPLRVQCHEHTEKTQAQEMV